MVDITCDVHAVVGCLLSKYTIKTPSEDVKGKKVYTLCVNIRYAGVIEFFERDMHDQ